MSKNIRPYCESGLLKDELEKVNPYQKNKTLLPSIPFRCTISSQEAFDGIYKNISFYFLFREEHAGNRNEPVFLYAK